MSRLCLVYIESIDSNQQKKISDSLVKIALNEKIGIVFNQIQFLDLIKTQHILLEDTNLLFNISDSFLFPTSENILCPDWCNTEEKREFSFKEYLMKIQKIILAINGGKIHLVIGETGGNYDDYLFETISVLDIAETIYAKSKFMGFVPDMHFLIDSREDRGREGRHKTGDGGLS